MLYFNFTLQSHNKLLSKPMTICTVCSSLRSQREITVVNAKIKQHQNNLNLNLRPTFQIIMNIIILFKILKMNLSHGKTEAQRN